ncbi:hypothetical protein SUGI_0248520 [Cryptomeria japonica]|nr:hypothetical protein SUGI_0248520 [Cryptomeria japonica]
MRFKAVHEVEGSSLADIIHMLAWGGIGTRMDVDIEELLTKWSYKFRPRISEIPQISVDMADGLKMKVTFDTRRWIAGDEYSTCGVKSLKQTRLG